VGTNTCGDAKYGRRTTDASVVRALKLTDWTMVVVVFWCWSLEDLMMVFVDGGPSDGRTAASGKRAPRHFVPNAMRGTVSFLHTKSHVHNAEFEIERSIHRTLTKESVHWRA